MPTREVNANNDSKIIFAYYLNVEIEENSTAPGQRLRSAQSVSRVGSASHILLIRIGFAAPGP